MGRKDGISPAMYVTVTGKRILVVRISVKKTLKTPKREIDLALSELRKLSDDKVRGFASEEDERSRISNDLQLNEAGLTQKQVAAKIKASQAAVARLESGSNTAKVPNVSK